MNRTFEASKIDKVNHMLLRELFPEDPLPFRQITKIRTQIFINILNKMLLLSMITLSLNISTSLGNTIGSSIWLIEK